MRRRTFISTSGVGAAAVLVDGGIAQTFAQGQQKAPTSRKPALMKVGATLRELDDDVVKSVVRSRDQERRRVAADRRGGPRPCRG